MHKMILGRRDVALLTLLMIFLAASANAQEHHRFRIPHWVWTREWRQPLLDLRMPSRVWSKEWRVPVRAWRVPDFERLRSRLDRIEVPLRRFEGSRMRRDHWMPPMMDRRHSWHARI